MIFVSAGLSIEIQLLLFEVLTAHGFSRNLFLSPSAPAPKNSLKTECFSIIAYCYFQKITQQFNTIMSLPKVVMISHVIDCNERESQRPSLCREIIIIQKDESKKWDAACLAGQIADNQVKDDFLILQTRQNECWKMAFIIW